MKKTYEPETKSAIEQVIDVFNDYIRTSTHFELLWSDKVGYIYISIDNVQGSIGDTGCCVVNRIIRAFLQLQKERGFVCRPELEARCQDPEGHADVYVRDFRGNFTSMKTDAGKSHGKVFRDDGYNITICTEVLATLEQYRSLFEA